MLLSGWTVVQNLNFDERIYADMEINPFNLNDPMAFFLLRHSQNKWNFSSSILGAE